jgi:hypothetical protein
VSSGKAGALRLLAPQMDLIAIGQNQNREALIVQSVAKVLIVVIPAKAGIQGFPAKTEIQSLK